MSVETDIVTMSTQLKGIKENTEDIKKAVFGNGSKGIKVKVIILEVKFWILLVLILPIWFCAVKMLASPEAFKVIQAAKTVIE